MKLYLVQNQPIVEMEGESFGSEWWGLAALCLVGAWGLFAVYMLVRVVMFILS